MAQVCEVHGGSAWPMPAVVASLITQLALLPWLNCLPGRRPPVLWTHPLTIGTGGLSLVFFNLITSQLGSRLGFE